MNDSFSFRRFGLLLRLQLSEHLRTYLLGMVVIVGVLGLMLYGTLNLKGYHESVYRNHGMVFALFFCIGGCWFSSEAFRMVSTPLRGIPFLTLPASQTEKYLAAFLIALLFIPVYIGLFDLVEGTYFSFVNRDLPASESRYGLLDLTREDLRENLYTATLAQALFLLGSLYFSKAAFVKTGVIALGLFILVMYLNTKMLHWVMPTLPDAIDRVQPFRGFNFVQSQQSYRVELTGTLRTVYNTFLILLFPVFWAIAYLRFREKQI